MMKFITTPFTIEDIIPMKQAGAAAVMISTPFFSVRGAALFEVSQLPEVKSLCVEQEIEMFVQVNRFFVEEELDALRIHLKQLKDLEVDGIYFTDEGVLHLANELDMADKLMYHPDTLLTNHMDVNFYLEQNLHSIVLAKEITLEEIVSIASLSDASKIEVMIHGRLNMMHSKRPLISHYLNFINKEVDIKHKYSLYVMEETRDAHMPILEDDQGTHVFSGFTQCFFDEIKVLEKAGIGYVRIDSIFYDGAYGIAMLKAYQDILQDKRSSDEIMRWYQEAYPNDNIASGFLYTKTSKTK